MNGTLFFRANDGTNGNELWKSDGTEAGTVLVKDIWAGTPSSWPDTLVNLNDTLYFSADDEIHGRELWQRRYRGGYVMVREIVPGVGRSNPHGW